jgi:hypothetical protein
MSDEWHKTSANEEPQDEVEGHGFKISASDEPADEAEDDVEAHGLPKVDRPRTD